jgi:uncharacterized tellurite resistance protein B-like protein
MQARQLDRSQRKEMIAELIRLEKEDHELEQIESVLISTVINDF